MAKIVITGGPGCGKTTLLNKLAERGHAVVKEAAREVIDEHGGKYEGMQHDIYDRQLVNEANGGDILDRSLVDSVAYASHFSDSLDRDWKTDLAGRYDRVFILDTLPEEFYRNDDARDETYEEAIAIHTQILSTYRELGYDVVQLPATTPQDRLERFLSELPEEKDLEHELKFAHTEIDLSPYVFHPCEVSIEHNAIRFITDGYERIRSATVNGETTFAYTVKTGKGITRREEEMSFHSDAYEGLMHNFHPTLSYEKKRITHTPFGDSKTTICLDEVKNLGKFVEIESSSPRMVKTWANRLGLTEVIDQSYAQMISQRE